MTELQTNALAPEEGIVLRQFKDQGTRVRKGDPLLALSNPMTSFVEASIPASLLGQMKVGLEATIVFTPFSNKKWVGRIATVGPEVVEDRIRIRIQAQDLPPYPGLTGEIAIRVK